MRSRAFKPHGERFSIVFTVDEVRKILSVCDEHMRLYLLLSVNCGILQNDISELSPPMIDWDQRVLTYKREKTKRFEKVPKVEFKLWDETFELLTKYGRRTGKYLLLDKDNQQLRTAELVGDIVKHRDSLTWFFEQYRDNAGITGKSWKHLRKTSSNLIESHPIYGRLTSLFLGQREKETKRFYVTPPQELLNEAVAWLRTQILGVEEK